MAGTLASWRPCPTSSWRRSPRSSTRWRRPGLGRGSVRRASSSPSPAGMAPTPRNGGPSGCSPRRT
eukprot:8685196-Lingulodinium_polyedra.AAC.1